MRKTLQVLALSISAVAGSLQTVYAGFVGMPMGLNSAIQHIKFQRPTLPPMAYTQFCLRYRDDCRPRPIFRGGPLRLTPERMQDLMRVNETVNRGIIPERNVLGLMGEEWLINPEHGDCNDYAVSKRHELLRLAKRFG